MKTLALLLIFLAVPAMGQTVASCPTASPGTAWASGQWLPCAAAPVYLALPLPATALVADMSKGGTVFSWTPASNVQATDAVWAKTTAAPTGTWTAAISPNFIVATTITGGSTATLSWVPPTANTDGTPLTDLASYNLLLGTSATALSKVANIPAPATSYAFKGLVPGTYWFAVQAVSTSEGASANSTSPSLTITKAVVSPSAPTSVTVTAIVTVP